MNKRSDSAVEFGILSVLLFAVLVIIVFGLLSPTDAHDYWQRQSATDKVMQHFSQLIGATITTAQVQQFSMIEYPFAKAVIECPDTKYLPVQGVKITFKYQGASFDYRVDAAVTKVVLCHVKVT